MFLTAFMLTSLVFTPMIEVVLKVLYMLMIQAVSCAMRGVSYTHRGFVFCAGVFAYSLNLCIMVKNHKLYTSGSTGVFISGVALLYVLSVVYMCALIITQYTASAVLTFNTYMACRYLRHPPPKKPIHPSEIARPVMKRPSLRTE